MGSHPSRWLLRPEAFEAASGPPCGAPIWWHRCKSNPCSSSWLRAPAQCHKGRMSATKSKRAPSCREKHKTRCLSPGRRAQADVAALRPSMIGSCNPFSAKFGDVAIGQRSDLSKCCWDTRSSEFCLQLLSLPWRLSLAVNLQSGPVHSLHSLRLRFLHAPASHSTHHPCCPGASRGSPTAAVTGRVEKSNTFKHLGKGAVDTPKQGSPGNCSGYTRMLPVKHKIPDFISHMIARLGTAMLQCGQNPSYHILVSSQ